MNLIDIDSYQLKEIVKNKKLICFGVGRMARNFINDDNNACLAKNIYLFMDNDKTKVGTKVIVADRAIDVVSPSYLDYANCADYIMLIACMGVVEVLQQLKEVNMDCCYSGFVRSATEELLEKNRYYPDNLRITSTPIIPKVIHYCWFGGNPLLERYKKWMASWKKCCPDYEIVEWNESNYDYKKNEYMFNAYKAKKWGFVSDYARLDVIYNHGGIYLDTDVELIKNLDDLLYQEAFAAVDESHRVSFGLGIGAVRGNHLFKEMLEVYENLHFDNSDMIASPTIFKDFFSNKGYVHNGEYQIIEGMTIYPQKVMAGKKAVTGAILTTEKTYAIHQYDGSWTDVARHEREKNIWKLYESIHSCDLKK